CHSLELSLEIDLDLGRVEGIETDFDGLAGQMGRSFVETLVQQEGAIAAHQSVHPMKEQAAQIGGGRELPDVFNVALPAQQRGGLQSAVLGAVIDVVDPGPQKLVQRFQRQGEFGIEVGQELFAQRAEVALDFAAPFG